MSMMKIITLSICLLIYGFQNSTAWYENEKVGTATLNFCKETGTPRLAIFHTTKIGQRLWLWVHWSLSDLRSMPDRRVGRQSVTSRRSRGGVYSEVLYIWRLTHGRTHRIRITPALLFIKYVWHDIQGFMGATWLTNIFTRRIICIPSWSVLKLCSQKSTSLEVYA
jgi:hypothetical protein